MHGAWCPVYCIGPQGNRNVFFLTFSIHTWREMREKTTRTQISPSSHSNQHVQQAPQAPLLDNPTDVMKSHGWWLKRLGFFLVIKYLYRQTQWLILVLPVKTAIFRWEIHHDPAPKKALDEGVSDAHFGEKLLGPGPPGPWAAGFCWTDLESFCWVFQLQGEARWSKSTYHYLSN